MQSTLKNMRTEKRTILFDDDVFVMANMTEEELQDSRQFKILRPYIDRRVQEFGEPTTKKQCRKIARLSINDAKVAGAASLSTIVLGVLIGVIMSCVAFLIAGAIMNLKLLKDAGNYLKKVGVKGNQTIANAIAEGDTEISYDSGYMVFTLQKVRESDDEGNGVTKAVFSLGVLVKEMSTYNKADIKANKQSYPILFFKLEEDDGESTESKVKVAKLFDSIRERDTFLRRLQGMASKAHEISWDQVEQLFKDEKDPDSKKTEESGERKISPEALISYYFAEAKKIIGDPGKENLVAGYFEVAWATNYNTVQKMMGSREKETCAELFPKLKDEE